MMEEPHFHSKKYADYHSYARYNWPCYIEKLMKIIDKHIVATLHGANVPAKFY